MGRVNLPFGFSDLQFSLQVKATLKITEPTGHVSEQRLDEGRTYTIGRARENDIVLNDRRVSRRHAQITGERRGFVIVDGHYENGRLVRSVNRLFVNGVETAERVLEDGDLLTIGESTLEFRSDMSAGAPVERFKASIPPLPSSSSLSGSAAAQVSTPAAEISYDDSPLGHTQVQISANEIIGRQSHLTLETAAVSPEEIKELRRKAKILGLLYEMSKTLGSVFDLKEVFEKATDLIFRGTTADRVVALLTDESAGAAAEQNELYQIAVKTRDERIARLTENLTVSRTITQKVMRERVALLSQDARAEEQFSLAESIVSQGVRSTICAPLITESGVHGVVYADRLDPFAAFSPDDLELITAVAAQTALAVETVKAHTRLAREEVARANYSRFMPEYVVRQLLENPDSFRLGGANQVVTVMFADIRGFTAISEHENPEKIVRMLNRYFSAMSEIIFEHGGTLDKYIGDGLMAIFGAPNATPRDAFNAVSAAIEMQRSVAELNQLFAAEGFPQISVGIGLHTGEATIGYIGSERRSEYTAIGDTVNLASRLESIAGGGQILISEATATASGSSFPLASRDSLLVKNRLQPVSVFEVSY